MATRLKSEMKAEPDLTPMLDVVFQLMTFFLMVMNFSKDDFDARVRLPMASSARPVEIDPDEDRLVLNVDRNGRLLLGGQEYDAERGLREIRQQAQLIRLNARVAGREIPPGGALPTTLVIRADRATEFGQLYRIIRDCQGMGFQSYALKALRDQEP